MALPHAVRAVGILLNIDTEDNPSRGRSISDLLDMEMEIRSRANTEDSLKFAPIIQEEQQVRDQLASQEEQQVKL